MARTRSRTNVSARRYGSSGLSAASCDASSGKRSVPRGQDRLESRRRAADAVRQRQPAGEQLDATLQEPQALLAHQLECLHRGGGRDERVAVAVAADPRPEAQQRRDLEPLARVELGERLLEVAVHARHRLGERRGEVDQPAADLLQHGERGRAQLVGSPQLLHGGQQPPPRADRVGVRYVVELSEHAEQPRELVDRRAPARLGGVGGHHEPQLGAAKQLAELGGGCAARGELRDRVAHRPSAGRRRIARVATAKPAHALVVLGQVDELEPAGQRPDQHLGLVEVEARHQGRQVVAGGLVTAARRAPEGHRVVEQLDRRVAVARAHHVVEDFGQERFVAREVAQRRTCWSSPALAHASEWSQPGADGVARCAGGPARWPRAGHPTTRAGCARTRLSIEAGRRVSLCCPAARRARSRARRGRAGRVPFPRRA